MIEEHPHATRGLRVCLFGAAGDTSNLGVTALQHATIASITNRAPETRFTVFDGGWGMRRDSVPVGSEQIDTLFCGARLSRRYHRPESYWNIRVSSRLGGLHNPGARALLDADVVLDASGGDSFTDLYGPKRLAKVCAPKHLALDLSIPLVLLPQTYGPFESARARREAQKLVRGSAMTWARDADSYRNLRALLGEDLDADRHRQGVDMAFLLPASRPVLPAELEGRLNGSRDDPLVGLNVSGLLFNDPGARHTYGLRVNYRELMTMVVRRIIETAAAHVILVSHVNARSERPESDQRAAKGLVEGLPNSMRERVIISPRLSTPGEVKWLVSRTEWFCGTRMHSTIAAMSSGIPAAGIAYSDKMRGVFDTCGLGDQVIDARTCDTTEAAELLLGSFIQREAVRARLKEALPGALRTADSQINEIVAACRRFAVTRDTRM